LNYIIKHNEIAPWRADAHSHSIYRDSIASLGKSWRLHNTTTSPSRPRRSVTPCAYALDALRLLAASYEWPDGTHHLFAASYIAGARRASLSAWAALA